MQSIAINMRPSKDQRVCLFVALFAVSFFFITGCGSSSFSSNSTAPSPPTPPSSRIQWTWVSGSNLANQPGTYGQLGTPASSNVPSGRYGAATWVDAFGNLWLFGGIADPTATSDTYFNDLWEFSNGQWTWVSGSNMPNRSGIYGALGVAASDNIPGARTNAVTWKDSSGNLWLFGGSGLDATGRSESLNDLWRYSNGEWTWMGGPPTTITGTPGTYGTKGVADTTNLPGGRSDAVSWTDNSGNFWLFGGLGEDSVGNWGVLNDLWKFSNGQWTWVNGSNIIGQSGSYGSLGTPDPANVPAGRFDASAWIDSSGNLWLFGGAYSQMVGSSVVGYRLNDLWRYSNGQWTWMAGSNQGDQQGNYGTLGVASPANNPGARSGAAAWTDSSGNFWLFGGCCSAWPDDLWKYSNGQWTWEGGSQVAAPGVYGTLGVASSSNNPGSRLLSSTWVDHSGSLWLFGGHGYDSTGTGAGAFGYLNDLWKFQP